MHIKKLVVSILFSSDSLSCIYSIKLCIPLILLMCGTSHLLPKALRWEGRGVEEGVWRRECGGGSEEGDAH